MSNQFGRFEILSEIHHSQLGWVYKASDPQSNQTVALKTIRLDLLGEQAAAYVQRISEESASAKVLNSHNLSVAIEVEEIEGQLCASLEYVQGNSVATMLARKEGFSIWDLQDIARQACQGLDHAHVKNVFHYSLEPAKIMVTWDGTVKILGFGISTMGAYAAQALGPAPEALHYMSPEQLRDDPLDARSNLFSLGAILYEMVTERAAFQGEEADQVRQSILEMTPVAPDQINRKIHPALNQVIMRALSKDPEERYQSGQELVNDLERCKESSSKPARPAAVAAAPQRPSAPAIATPKAVAPPPVAQQQSAPSEPSLASMISKPLPPAQKPAVAASSEAAPAANASRTPAPFSPQKAAAAAAGIGSRSGLGGNGELPRMPKLDPSQQFVSSCVKASVEAFSDHGAKMSAATAEPEVESPRIKVDPMMAEAARGAGSSRQSFSEIDELPPLKETYIAPPPPPVSGPAEEPQPETVYIEPVPEKPKVQPREVARKAVKEIQKTPPKLFMYAIAGAIGVILLIIVGIAFHVRNEDSDDETAPVQTSAPAPAASQPAVAAPVAAAAPAVVAQAAPPVEVPPSVSIKSKFNPKAKKVVAKAPVPVPVVIPGQVIVNSVPAGAQVHIDGQTDPSWMTPYNMAGITPGQHSIIVSKAGYTTETRSVDVASGSKSVIVVQLAALMAGLSVAGEPAGASIFIDGKDTGRVTPSQLSFDKPGTHTLTIKKQGFLEETTTATLQAGQTFHYAPSLKALGNADAIKTVGKFKKMFGGSGDISGMGLVSVKTQPKGAQIAVNNRMLDKGSPVDFYLNPGNYVLDITATGYKSIHKVITVDKGGKGRR